jgi:hypothetical protein
VIIKAQEGFQEAFLSSSADIVLGGGSKGGGKSFALLMEPLRHIHIKDFTPVFFRNTTQQIRASGGIWETSKKLYSGLNVVFGESMLKASFSSGAFMKFAHLEYEKDLDNWQGSQIPYIAFDELTHFSWNQFITMLSCNRSVCGVRPYMRATCNPDPDSWVRDFIDWWIDADGYIIPERCGVIRFFTVDEDDVVWGSTKAEVLEKCAHKFKPIIELGKNPEDLIKSFTFIEGNVYGNKALLDADPGYLGNLLALPEQERKRLLDGNWNVKIEGLGLCMDEKISDIFTNEIRANPLDTYITIDHARLGRDLCVITTWQGWKASRTDILTTSDTNDIVKVVKHRMLEYRVGSSNIIVDQDGIGVYDHFKNSKLFMGGSKAIGPNKKIYKNLKTECHYFLCEEIVNKNEIFVDIENMWVDGVRRTSYMIGKKTYDIRSMILRQYRTIRQHNIDKDGKKEMEGKDMQKNKLGGASPDFTDNHALRAFFSLKGRGSLVRKK